MIRKLLPAPDRCSISVPKVEDIVRLYFGHGGEISNLRFLYFRSVVATLHRSEPTTLHFRLPLIRRHGRLHFVQFFLRNYAALRSLEHKPVPFLIRSCLLPDIVEVVRPIRSSNEE